MADDERDKGRTRSRRRRPDLHGGTRMVWIVGASLIVLLAGIAIAASALKKSKPTPKGARAVIVPTSDAARTVVVPPCNTGESIADASVARQMRTLGTTTVQLPRDSGLRIVVIPRCAAGEGTTANPGANLPSAAFVLRVGARVTSDRGGQLGAFRSQLVVPNGSRATSIVVPQCTGAGGKSRRAVVLGTRSVASRTAVAPAC